MENFFYPNEDISFQYPPSWTYVDVDVGLGYAFVNEDKPVDVSFADHRGTEKFIVFKPETLNYNDRLGEKRRPDEVSINGYRAFWSEHWIEIYYGQANEKVVEFMLNDIDTKQLQTVMSTFNSI